MAYVITSKYADFLTLYCLNRILTRHGIDLPRQTLSESVLKTAERITPLIDHMNTGLRAQTVLLGACQGKFCGRTKSTTQGQNRQSDWQRSLSISKLAVQKTADGRLD